MVLRTEQTQRFSGGPEKEVVSSQPLPAAVAAAAASGIVEEETSGIC